jgi:hypothetical protein
MPTPTMMIRPTGSTPAARYADGIASFRVESVVAEWHLCDATSRLSYASGVVHHSH